MSNLSSIQVSGAGDMSIDQAFDNVVNAHIKARGTPGAALAVVKDERLVYARGYGFADVEKREAPRPDSLFRIASISKTFTGVAVTKLAAKGRLDMDAPAFGFLDLKPLPGQTPDVRLKQITVRHLLHHTGGWDRDKSGDPMFMSEKIAKANGETPPANQRAIIRYMLGQPLDFDPGTRYAYSNFGYCVLGRIIEKVTGQPYDAFMRGSILAPIGIRHMRLGRSHADQRAEGEVKYYMPDGPLTDGETRNEPYTGFCLEAMDSHGGWLASAVDLARYAAALNNPNTLSWMPTEARKLLYEEPAPPVSRKPDGSLEPTYYTCGWMARPVDAKGANYWHTGSLPGTFTLLVRRHDGLAWAILLNQRSSDPKLPDKAIDEALHEAADAVVVWPKEDLFQNYT